MASTPQVAGVVQVAVRVKSVPDAEPPLLLITLFVRLKDGATSLLVTVQVFVCPTASVPVQSAEKLAA